MFHILVSVSTCYRQFLVCDYGISTKPSDVRFLVFKINKNDINIISVFKYDIYPYNCTERDTMKDDIPVLRVPRRELNWLQNSFRVACAFGGCIFYYLVKYDHFYFFLLTKLRCELY